MKQVTRITGGYWAPRLAINAEEAIYYQWEQLEQTLCINNFRLAAGSGQGFREGFFFSDSDAYKWLDAASRILKEYPDTELARLVEDFIDLLAEVQMPDGYLNTYNQVHFPGRRWASLQLEHEFYMLGHLIEAGIAHFTSTGETRLLELVRRAADLLVRDFMEAGPEKTDGHEEIEIALIKLYRATGEQSYLELARRLIERRGRINGYGIRFIRQALSTGAHMQRKEKQRLAYLVDHPEHGDFELPPSNEAHTRPQLKTWPRLLSSLLSGKYAQQHRPIRDQLETVGHSVRHSYLKAAVAMLYRETGDESLLESLSQSWEQMVTKRMYVTGGLGSLPLIEGFGRDYELDPEMAYAETCAALGCMFWNWEMTLITQEAHYADLFEWQLYNAASVGIGLDGRSYLYNNPLESRTGMARRGWFDVPCCPSNLSRVWASLPDQILSSDQENIWVHQFITCESKLPDKNLSISIESAFPWEAEAQIKISTDQPANFVLQLRVPSWAEAVEVRINGELQEIASPERLELEKTAGGYDPRRAWYLPLEREWKDGDVVELVLPMRIVVRPQHPKVRSCAGRSAVSRGPIVYCLESVDNPSVDIFKCVIEAESLEAIYSETHFGGCWVLRGKTTTGDEVISIPYMLWANRGRSQMTTMLQIKE